MGSKQTPPAAAVFDRSGSGAFLASEPEATVDGGYFSCSHGNGAMDGAGLAGHSLPEAARDCERVPWFAKVRPVRQHPA